MEKAYRLIDHLARDHSLSADEYEYLISHRNSDIAAYAAGPAVETREKIYGKDVYIRGLIEISNICRNDCLYCGIRRGAKSCQRYRLTPDEILLCAEEGYALGYRTFVLQGGEDGSFTDEVLCPLIEKIKSVHPDCAVTLSLGERSRDSYQRLFDSGADRYLLRHETADKEHYEKLHPGEMSFDNRMECLHILRDIGYQVGCGFMVGSPYQTSRTLAKDLRFIGEFKPDMCGIGPFIPHHDTAFRDMPAGTLEETVFLLSLIRLIRPNILLPATTALGTIAPDGREKGILAGANVIMPNLSPVSVRKKYELYDGKVCTGEEAAECRNCIESRMKAIGYRIVTDRGDVKK
ncbi:MAG: [Clostridia bacterium]|nr:[FeFe] hydrogenase H-cluster radical SAM maturase HydE [Clostridia bacterium]